MSNTVSESLSTASTQGASCASRSPTPSPTTARSVPTPVSRLSPACRRSSSYRSAFRTPHTLPSPKPTVRRPGCSSRGKPILASRHRSAASPGSRVVSAALPVPVMTRRTRRPRPARPTTPRGTRSSPAHRSRPTSTTSATASIGRSAAPATLRSPRAPTVRPSRTPRPRRRAGKQGQSYEQSQRFEQSAALRRGARAQRHDRRQPGVRQFREQGHRRAARWRSHPCVARAVDRACCLASAARRADGVGPEVRRVQGSADRCRRRAEPRRADGRKHRGTIAQLAVEDPPAAERRWFRRTAGGDRSRWRIARCRASIGRQRFSGRAS